MLMDSFYHSQSTDDSLTGFKLVPHISTLLFAVTHNAVYVDAHWESWWRQRRFVWDSSIFLILDCVERQSFRSIKKIGGNFKLLFSIH